MFMLLLMFLLLLIFFLRLLFLLNILLYFLRLDLGMIIGLMLLLFSDSLI
jgi:hypothetical protein